MIIGRQLDGAAFADMIIDQFDEMLLQANHPQHPQPLVMGIALHPYLVGQPYRLRHLRRALAHIAARRAWRGLADHAGRDLRCDGRAGPQPAIATSASR
jgi:hypothetical protein